MSEMPSGPESWPLARPARHELAGGSGPIALSEEARELVALELQYLMTGVPAERRGPYDALAEAVNQGSVPPALAPLLERVVGVALETNRAGHFYRAEGERVLNDVFKKTPGGRQLAENLEAVNRALTALGGRTLLGVRVAMRTLGHFTVTLETEDVSLTLVVRPHGVSVESLGVGGSPGPG